ncbi:(Fe-S)-binding protein [Helicobacter suis]|uniref:(Fe-S)-binding protein n=1 Tax=Helicobacter suis TaxID=104628 RepID=UPI001F07F510|nr:(Fe-S)-binding protein [Helicobacter suis]
MIAILKPTKEKSVLAKPSNHFNALWQEIESSTNACVKCAKCIPTCTIYRIHKDEITSPRGFLDLIAQVKQESLELDNSLKKIFETCFLCTTCVQVCPLHLPIDAMIERIRHMSANKHGISWHKKIYFYLLKHPKLMDFVFSLCDVLAPCVFKKDEDKLKWRFKGSKAWQKRVIFPFARKSFLQTYKGLITPQNPLDTSTPPRKVGIFIGCLSNYNYTEVGQSLLSLLDKLNISALIPEQFCCGAPAYFTGDLDTAYFLAQKNIASLYSIASEVEAILVPEATCIGMLKKDYLHILESLSDEKDRISWLEKFKVIEDKLQLASAFLANSTPLKNYLQKRPQIPLTLTYHDPCHAKKVLGVFKEPRALLQINHSLIEMQESDRCCGFGGVSMQSEHYDLVLKAGAPKALDIAQTKAQVVSAECSACRMQINNSLAQIESSVQFLHPIELLDHALTDRNFSFFKNKS